MTEAPPTITYASILSRETVRLALTITALNDLEVKVGNVTNYQKGMDNHKAGIRT